MAYKIHAAQHNPYGWKWRLVLWLTGGKLEVVPMLPRRAIYSTETLVVKLGREGALNTVEVKHMYEGAELKELLPMRHIGELTPDTWIAVDHRDGPEGTVRQDSGTFINWIDQHDGGTRHDIIVLELPGGDSRRRLHIAVEDVVKAYWAPVGYRPRP